MLAAAVDKRVVQRTHRELAVFELTTTDTLISEVEIISILIRSVASTSNMVEATPEWVRMPTPTTETLAT